jgi:integrase
MAGKAETKKDSGKIAAFVAKYSNGSTGSNYRSAIESFLRCINNLDKVDSTTGKKSTYNYESLFDAYLSDKKRDRSTDIKLWSECLVRESVSKQSARQRLTYGVRVLKAHGCTVSDIDVQDIKRETKGGAATIDKVMTGDVICKSLRSADVQLRALILCLASSGLRIGELTNMTMADIDLAMTPVMVNVRPEIAKNGQYRYTFISQEATDALKEYLKVREKFISSKEKRVANLQKSGRVATANSKTDLIFPLEESTINGKWEAVLRKAELFSRDATSNRNQYRIHSLRKFFISQLSLAGHKTLAEHLAGHTGYLDQSYRQVSPEFAAREYLKLQSVLTCCLPENIKQGIKIADEKIGILMEKTELQTEGIEGLKIINAQLRERMQQQQEQMAAQQQQIDQITALVKLMAEREGINPAEELEFAAQANLKPGDVVEVTDHIESVDLNADGSIITHGGKKRKVRL